MGMPVETKAFFDWSGDSGSVLMEFIIVLPIYMLLLGFAFVVGELALDTIHLAGSGDRARAFSSDSYDLGDASEKPFEKYRLAASPNTNAWDGGVAETRLAYTGDSDIGSPVVSPSVYDDGTRDAEDRSTGSRVYVADSGIEGPWVEMTAGVVVDNYTLPPWTRGLVAYWYRQEHNTTKETTKLGSGSVDDMLAKGDSLGRTPVKGKDLNGDPDVTGSEDRRFGFYTLRRIVRRSDWERNPRLPYRTWGNGQLVSGGELWRNVALERFPDENDASSYKGIDGTEDTGKLPPEWQGGDVATYPRNGDLKEWSN